MLLNMQHLLNMLRPYEARASLISTLQAQVDEKQQLIERLRLQQRQRELTERRAARKQSEAKRKTLVQMGLDPEGTVKAGDKANNAGLELGHLG